MKEFWMDDYSQGEYLNGKRNGLWKYYDKKDGTLIKEVEYLNGEYHGKWKRYYKNGTLSIDIEYLNGEKKHGKNITLMVIWHMK